MVLWGGLRPIAGQVALDSIALIGLSHASFSGKETKLNLWCLLGACLVTVLATSEGITSRWTLIFPMIPLLVLQAVRRLFPSLSKRTSFVWVIGILSANCILSAAALTIAFPAVELPPINGPFNVGVVDLFLPLQHAPANGAAVSINGTCDSNSEHNPREKYISARLLYPTLDPPQRMPYVRPEIATEFFTHFIRLGAPPPLKKFGWLLHPWKLTKLPMKQNAQLLPASRKQRLPLILYSHGLAGTADIYSYQTMALAAHGSVVVSINHQDGSAPVVQTHPDGSTEHFDYDVGQLWQSGRKVDYVRERRSRTNLRVQEMVAAVETLREWNDGQVVNSDAVAMSFRGRLDVSKTFAMGHSFGGATALTAAKRMPELFNYVIAHEPASDWIPDDTRRSLFAEDRLQGLSHNFTGGTGGYETPSDATDDSSIHDLDMFFLYSQEWHDQKWGGSHLLTHMHEMGKLGSRGGISNVGFVPEAHHTEFSDTILLSPLWLTRGIGLAGARNPIHTAKEIEERTRAFVTAFDYCHPTYKKSQKEKKICVLCLRPLICCVYLFTLRQVP